MEGEFTKEQIDEFKEAFTVFDKGTSIYYVGMNFWLLLTRPQYWALESFCCKKSPNQEIGLRRFSEYRTSEGSEWYQIDPRWLRGHSCPI